MKIREALSWMIVGALVVLLSWSLYTDSGEPVVIEKHTTDTLVIQKIDTVTITKTVEIVKEKVDTTYITVRDSIPVPIFLSEYQFNKGRFYAFSSILVYSLLKTFFL